MPRKKERTSEPPVAKDHAAGWSRRGKAIVSCFVAFHVAAVFFAPFRFSTTSGPDSPRSAFVQLINPGFDWYIQGMFLDHGYAFFAPDPGPSNLVRYECHFDDGREPIIGTFPDLNDQWPRLLYHRHFMLSEQLNMDFIPSDPPPDFPGSRDDWQQFRRPYTDKWDAFEAHLRTVYDADRVTLTRVQHGLPSDDDVLGGMKLNDPRLYRELPENSPPDAPRTSPPAEPPMLGPLR